MQRSLKDNFPDLFPVTDPHTRHATFKCGDARDQSEYPLQITVRERLVQLCLTLRPGVSYANSGPGSEKEK